MSCVTCHMLQFLLLLFFLFYFFWPNGEASWWRVCYQRGLPRVVLQSSTLHLQPLALLAPCPPASCFFSSYSLILPLWLLVPSSLAHCSSPSCSLLLASSPPAPCSFPSCSFLLPLWLIACCWWQPYTYSYTPLYCTTTLHCTTLHYTALHYTALHYTALHYTELHYIILQYIVLHCNALHWCALHCSTMHAAQYRGFSGI